MYPKESSIEQEQAIHQLTRELALERNLTQEYEDIIAAERRDRARLRIELEEAYNREKELRKEIERRSKQVAELTSKCESLSIELAHANNANEAKNELSHLRL